MAPYLQGTSTVDASRAPKLEITYKPIEHLRLAADNPRKHPKKQIKQIAASISLVGLTTSSATVSQSGKAQRRVT